MPAEALVFLTVAVTSTVSRAATLVPGGGNARTDCVLQLSGEGVGFPAGKTAKGISCADGDLCDLDGRRNGVCVFQLGFCVNEPTRSCQPRSVTQATLKTNKKPPIDVAPLQAALAALPLPTSAIVCSPPVLVSVVRAGSAVAERLRRHHRRVPSDPPLRLLIRSRVGAGQKM